MKCRKRGYDEIGAMLALAEAKNAKSGKHAETRYYKCSECGKYHLTSARRIK